MTIDTPHVVGSAPGKVILCGEYSVLEGFPCIVMAMNRRLTVSISENPGRQGVEVLACGLRERCEWLRIDGHRLRCQSSGPLVMLTCLLNELLNYHQCAPDFLAQGWQVEVNSQALFSGDQKLGLGSSAAMTVALDTAICALINATKSDVHTRWQYLHKIHSLAQGKRGSGADIAACLNGGATIFAAAPEPQVSDFSLPAELDMAFIWSGASASTPAFLSSLDHWRQAHPQDYRDVLTRLGTSVTRLTCVSDGALFIDELDTFCQYLQEFAVRSGLDIYGAGHAQLNAFADDFPGVIYKPCGAGGGDLGIALGCDARQLGNFVQSVGELGYATLDLEIDERGSMRHTP